MDDPEILDDDIRKLLDSTKALPELSATAKDGLFARVSSLVGAVPPPDGSGHGDGGSSGDGGATTSGGAGPAVESAGRVGSAALSGGKAVAALVSTFAIGIVTGIAVDRAVAPPPPVPVAPVATIATAAPPPVTTIADAPALPIEALPSAPARPARPTPAPTPVAEPSASPSPSARGLAAERALLDVARGALARGEAQAALVAAERHGAAYPNGALVEEREAIAIKALVALDRRDEARRRAIEMERRFPNGLMLRAVKNAVGSAP